jgi:hypothetical protein
MKTVLLLEDEPNHLYPARLLATSAMPPMRIKYSKARGSGDGCCGQESLAAQHDVELRFRCPFLPLLGLAPSLLAIAFKGQCLFDAEFLSRLQVKGVPFDLPDDVLLHNLLFEAAERVL